MIKVMLAIVGSAVVLIWAVFMVVLGIYILGG